MERKTFNFKVENIFNAYHDVRSEYIIHCISIYKLILANLEHFRHINLKKLKISLAMLKKSNCMSVIIVYTTFTELFFPNEIFRPIPLTYQVKCVKCESS